MKKVKENYNVIKGDLSMTRAELGDFIIEKLKEIQKEYIEYIHQFDTSQIDGFENKYCNVLACSVFEESVSAFALAGEVDGRTVYMLSTHSEYGDIIKQSGKDSIALEDLFKKEEEKDGKENTEE